MFTCSPTWLGLIMLATVILETAGGARLKAIQPPLLSFEEGGGSKPITIKLQQRKKQSTAEVLVVPREVARLSVQKMKLQLLHSGHKKNTTRILRSKNGNGVSSPDQIPSAAASVKLSGHPVITYHALLHMGSDQQDLWVVVDTGSSNLAVAGPALGPSGTNQVFRTYDPKSSNSSQAQADSFEVTYVQGDITGEVYEDKVSFAGADRIHARVKFGVIDAATDFFVVAAANNEPYEGILGMGYPSLATAGVTPLFTSLVASGTLTDDAFGLLLCDNWIKYQVRGRTAWKLDDRSYMLLGNSEPIPPDQNKNSLQATPGQYIGEMYYTPLVTESYYTVTLRALSINGIQLDVPCSTYNSPGPSLVDSGTSVTWVPDEVHAALLQKFSDALLSVVQPSEKMDTDLVKRDSFLTGDYCAKALESKIVMLPNITFHFPLDGSGTSGSGAREFGVAMLPLHYLRETSDKNGESCYSFAIMPWCMSQSGANLGMSFLNNVFVEFDRENKRIGFASSTCATGNLSEGLTTVQPPKPYGNPSTCESNTKLRCPGDQPQFGVVFWVFVGAASFLIIAAATYYIKSQRSNDARAQQQQQQQYDLANLGLDAGNLSDDSDDALLTSADDDDELVQFDGIVLNRVLIKSELEALEVSKAASMAAIRRKSAGASEDEQHAADLMLIAQLENAEVADICNQSLLE